MTKMSFIKIVFGFYSIFALFANGAPTMKDWELVKGLRNGLRKKETRSLVPEFEDTEDEIIAIVGQTVKLRCSVKNLGDNVVSWIRQKSLLILTSGLVTFASDYRFRVDHSEDDSDSWDLTLTNVRTSDAGFYECQINTEPKRKRAVHLIVASGDGDMNYFSDDSFDTSDIQIASIVGSTERFVHIGSIVTLTCLVRIVINEKDSNHWFPKYGKPILWFHNSGLLSIRAERGSLSIDTSRTSNAIVSNLIIAFVTYQDSGVYTCAPIRGQSANVSLVVLQNEEIEAVKPENYLQSNNAMKDDFIVTWKKLFLLYTMMSLFIRFPT